MPDNRPRDSQVVLRLGFFIDHTGDTVDAVPELTILASSQALTEMARHFDDLARLADDGSDAEFGIGWNVVKDLSHRMYIRVVPFRADDRALSEPVPESSRAADLFSQLAEKARKEEEEARRIVRLLDGDGESDPR